MNSASSIRLKRMDLFKALLIDKIIMKNTFHRENVQGHPFISYRRMASEYDPNSISLDRDLAAPADDNDGGKITV